MAKVPDQMERVVNLCKRRGFVFPSSDIYGGFRSTWDYGPLGVLLKRNVKEAWWRSMVQLRDDVVGLDSAILMHPRVWEASGHVGTFSDPLVDCKQCKERFRADHIDTAKPCPKCGTRDSFTEARDFNLMFSTQVGPVADTANIAYLRPETAQGIFVNFKNVQTTSRKKPPFGIAQQGKSFRNEITPGNFIFRTREFEQMEMEFFVPPAESAKWFEYWVDHRYNWHIEHGIPSEKLIVRPHEADELSHYSTGTSDIEFEFPWGWGELEGIAQRTDFDLKQHMQFSGEDLQYFDQEANEHYVPYVIEPALGADRSTLAFLLSAYDEETLEGGDTRTVLRLHKRLAPIKIAVLPLSKKDTLVPLVDQIGQQLRPHFQIDTDVSGAIGRRYRRYDEIGTPYCVTIDFDSLDDNAVTVRERDSMEQVRIPVADVLGYFREQFEV